MTNPHLRQDFRVATSTFHVGRFFFGQNPRPIELNIAPAMLFAGVCAPWAQGPSLRVQRWGYGAAGANLGA